MVRNIESTKNEYIKKLRSLNTKKARLELGLTIAFGKKLCLEAVKFVPNTIESIIISNEYDFDFKELQNNYDIYTLPDFVFESICEQKSPEGIAVVLNTAKLMISKEDFYNKKEENYLVLDNINDSANVGAMLRCADAFSFKNIILSKNCADVFAPKTLRGAMGAIYRLNILEQEEISCAYKFLKKNGIKIIASDLDGVDINTVKLKKPYAVVIGSEAHGLSRAAKDNCDIKLKIPMSGQTESLNAAVACGIILFSLNR